MNDKRQMIERALGPILEPDNLNVWLITSALAEQAIVIEGTMKHLVGHTLGEWSYLELECVDEIFHDDLDARFRWAGHQGKESKYLFIGVPLEEKE